MLSVLVQQEPYERWPLLLNKIFSNFSQSFTNIDVSRFVVNDTHTYTTDADSYSLLFLEAMPSRPHLSIIRCAQGPSIPVHSLHSQQLHLTTTTAALSVMVIKTNNCQKMPSDMKMQARIRHSGGWESNRVIKLIITSITLSTFCERIIQSPLALLEERFFFAAQLLVMLFNLKRTFQNVQDSVYNWVNGFGRREWT